MLDHELSSAQLLALLKEDVAAFNTYREEHPDHRIDLRKADLCKAILIQANLSGADLRGANLDEADLDHADLREADLTGVELGTALNIEHACFIDATMSHEAEEVLLARATEYTNELN